MELKDYPIRVPVAVRWSDMDAMGHVNNVVYYRYFEIARFRIYEMLGLDRPSRRRDRPDHGRIIMPLPSPAHLSRHLTVGARIKSVGKSSFVMDFLIDSEKSEPRRPVRRSS
jgi:acyl-CoA thioester hydrolase